MSQCDSIKVLYEQMQEKHNFYRKKLGRDITLTEKILFSHLVNDQDMVRGESFIKLELDRVAMQDATAQMALLQFMTAGKREVAVPTTVHCDHLILARDGAKDDLNNSLISNKEVYEFLESVASKYGIGFWKPGTGIIHQIVLENYAFPGGMMIGTDSHTPNAGGLGMMAIGVGGADAVDVMVGLPWEVKCPKIIGVHLKGKLNPWVSAKDIILKLCGLLTVKGATDHVIEYFGSGTKSISATGKATITNMGAELGATTSIFPYDEKLQNYLKITERKDWADLASHYSDCLVADEMVEKDPEKYFDKVIEIDLSSLEPYIVGPHSPDLARPISRFADEIQEKGYPDNFSYGMIGSCTNSSYEDVGKAASIAKQALDNGLKMKTNFMVSPGSTQIYSTIKRDGQLEILEKVGSIVLANACGPCIGQWQRSDTKSGQVNSIITSFNRNFKKRNDGNPETLAFIASPEIVTALSLAGKLSFNPLKDFLLNDKGEEFLLDKPESTELPKDSFVSDKTGYNQPRVDVEKNVIVDKDSERLQILTPFDTWREENYIDLTVLLKAKGKCTTDHISPAGKWLKFRGHLDNISNNIFSGVTNEFSDKVGFGKNQLSGSEQEIHEIAREYKKEGINWVVIGDENYGEGSSREHAAMSPRWLGGKVVIVKSFARIHETNLKKQGILPLTFIDTQDYQKILISDRISLLNLEKIRPNENITAQIKRSDGNIDKIVLNHSLNSEQIAWFKAGSALNVIRNQFN